MKKILITGLHSYIGDAFEEYIKTGPYSEQYAISKVSLRDDQVNSLDFTGFDSVLHVAGIAHVDTGKADEETKALYYKINQELAYKTASTAKAAGVKQFIYLSSMIVFGDSAPMGKQKKIGVETIPVPANFYGDSKLKAEKMIELLADSTFTITIVRPPMVYGKGSKGNYQKLAKLAVKSPFFPNIKNQRSMVYIENLCEILRLLINQNRGGIYCPQNKEYVTTSGLVKEIAAVHNKKIILVPYLNLIFKMGSHFTEYIDKIFGNMTYDKNMTEYENLPYQIYDFRESIRRTEGK